MDRPPLHTAEPIMAQSKRLPSSLVNAATAMGSFGTARASVKLVKEIGYENCGTIEYLVDDDGNFYFMEMNTRIQVEHPITEEVMGCELIKEQIRIAAGEQLSSHVTNARPRGHSERESRLGYLAYGTQCERKSTLGHLAPLNST